MCNSILISNGAEEYRPIGKTVYSLFKQSCADFHDLPALSYFGKRITFGELTDNINRAAAALKKAGVEKGDKVVVSLPSVPQAVELFYAVNKIGAIFCGMDCRSKKDEIDETIAQVKPKVCVVSDFHLKEFSHVDDVLIVCVSFMQTIGPLAAVASIFTDTIKGRTLLIARKKNFITYRQFISKGKGFSAADADVAADDVCAYFYTSGTTYGRKCVVLTNENMNCAVLQYAYSQPDIDDTDRFCTIMPLFTCYGITLGTHLPLILGKQIRMIPLFAAKNMKKLLLTEKPGYITTVPAHWEYFIKDNFRGVDMSFFKGAIVGGDKLSVVAEEKINSILRKCGSKGKVMRGYGLTEASTAVTAQPFDTPTGSVGTNMCWSTIRIFEPQTDVCLEDGKCGEICVCGPNICQGYLDDNEATGKLLKRHSDGKVWLHSGDIGYIDENKFLYFCERIKRIIVRFDGTKLSPFAIEQQLYRCPAVAHCMVYGIDDHEHDHGKHPAAMIVFKEEYNQKEAEAMLKKHIENNIAEHMRPVKTIVVNALPVTKNGKFDYFHTYSTSGVE